MPYFESLFCRPFLVKLLSAVLEKLDPAYSEQETDFEYVHNMLHTVSLGDYEIDNPVPLETLRLHVQQLEPKTGAGVVVGLVRNLLLSLDKYKHSYLPESNKGTKLPRNYWRKCFLLLRK